MHSRTSVGVGVAIVLVVVIAIVLVAALSTYFLLFVAPPASSTSSSSASSPISNSVTIISSSSALSTSGTSITTTAASTSSCYMTMSSSGAALTPVNIATLPGIITEPLYVANVTGLFADYGIKANLVTYSSDSAIMTAMGSGQAQYTIEVPDVVANSISSGVDVKIVSAILKNLTYGNAVMVRTNSSLTDVSQLNGKKVGVSALGSLTDIWAKMIMRKYNINFTEVALGATERTTALLAGQIDAAVAGGPSVYTLTTQGQARVLLNITGAIVPYFTPYAVAIVPGSLIQSQPNVVRGLLEATFQAIQYMENNPQKSYPILAAAIGTTPSLGPWLYNIALPYWSTDGTLDTGQMLQAIQLQNQLISSPYAAPSATSIYTSQFVPIDLTTC